MSDREAARKILAWSAAGGHLSAMLRARAEFMAGILEDPDLESAARELALVSPYTIHRAREIITAQAQINRLWTVSKADWDAGRAIGHFPNPSSSAPKPGPTRRHLQLLTTHTNQPPTGGFLLPKNERKHHDLLHLQLARTRTTQRRPIPRPPPSMAPNREHHPQTIRAVTSQTLIIDSAPRLT